VSEKPKPSTEPGASIDKHATHSYILFFSTHLSGLPIYYLKEELIFEHSCALKLKAKLQIDSEKEN